MKKLLSLALLAALPSCTYLTTFEAITKEAVDIYCSAPESTRQLNRINANRIIAPNQITITCSIP